MVYGPPGLRLGITKIPLLLVWAPDLLPVGSCTREMLAPATGCFFTSVTIPLSVAVVSWDWRWEQKNVVTKNANRVNRRMQIVLRKEILRVLPQGYRNVTGRLWNDFFGG